MLKGKNMETSEKFDELLKALFSFQSEITTAIVNEENPFYKNKYLDLAGIWTHIKKPLTNAGLGITQVITGKGEVETMLFHAESGQE